jgi:hypothetical protein
MVMPSPNGVGADFKQQRRIVVIYENSAAREHAVRSAPDITEASLRETSSAVQWWSFAKLAEMALAGEAAVKAAAADLVIFAISPAEDFPSEVKLWIETWITRRSDREGAIVGLMVRESSPGELACLKEIYLRQAAHRAGMDYLSQIPSGGGKAMPDSLDSYGERARQVTSVLDEILRSGLPPPTVNL